LCCKLTPDRVKKIIGGEHDRFFFGFNRQNVMLKDKTARQERQCLTVDALGIERDNWHVEEISDRAEEPLLIYLAGIKHLTHPRTTIQIRGQLRRFIA